MCDQSSCGTPSSGLRTFSKWAIHLVQRLSQNCERAVNEVTRIGADGVRECNSAMSQAAKKGATTNIHAVLIGKYSLQRVDTHSGNISPQCPHPHCSMARYSVAPSTPHVRPITTDFVKASARPKNRSAGALNFHPAGGIAAFAGRSSNHVCGLPRGDVACRHGHHGRHGPCRHVPCPSSHRTGLCRSTRGCPNPEVEPRSHSRTRRAKPLQLAKPDA